MRYLTIERILYLHQLVIERSGGIHGLRDEGALKSAVAQPRMTFDQVDLYPTLAAKAGALAFSLIQNHPFLDGNKRIGHAAIEAMLGRNGFELAAPVDKAERIILEVASSQRSREELIEWIEAHIVPSGRSSFG